MVAIRPSSPCSAGTFSLREKVFFVASPRPQPLRCDQHRPQIIVPIAPSRKMIGPRLPDHIRVKQSILLQQ